MLRRITTLKISADPSSFTTSSDHAISTSPSADAPSVMSSVSISRTMTTTTGASGMLSTVTAFITSTPTSIATNDSASSSPSIGKILGPVLGGLAFLVLLGSLVVLLFRRRRCRSDHKNDPSTSITPPTSPSQYTDMYPTKHDGHTPELDSHPIARGWTASGHRSELPGSDVPTLSQRRSQATGTTISPLLIQGPSSSDQTPSTGARVSPMMPARSSEQRQSMPGQLWGQSYQAHKPPPAELPAG